MRLCTPYPTNEPHGDNVAEHRDRLPPGERLGPNFDPSGANRVADGLRIRIGINQRIRRPQLLEPMDVTVPHKRLSVSPGPGDCRLVEVEAWRVHRIHFDGIEH